MMKLHLNDLKVLEALPRGKTGIDDYVIVNR